MKKPSVICLCSFVSIAALIANAADQWKLPPEKPELKMSKGAELAQADCLLCHSSEYISTQPAFTREQWKASVTKMQQKFGAPIPADHVEQLLDYLTSNYGKGAVK